MSLDKLYCHPTSSLQQMIVAAKTLDENTIWLIKPRHEAGDQQAFSGHLVKSGDIVRLEHVVTGRNLHSHADRHAPIDQTQQEVTGCGENGKCDSNDNWIVEPKSGAAWLTDQPLRLVHDNTKAALHSHQSFHPLYTEGYQEVTGFAKRDENDMWICQAGEQPHSLLGERPPLHKRGWVRFLAWFVPTFFGFVSMVFQITGPLSAETLALMPRGLSVMFQTVSNFLSQFGYYVAAVLFLGVIYWKRTLFKQFLARAWSGFMHIYVVSLSFLLRPVIRHVDMTQLQIVAGQYGTADKFMDVTKLLQQRIVENKLVLDATNETFGCDPAQFSPKQLKVEYLYFGKRGSVVVDEGKSLRIP